MAVQKLQLAQADSLEDMMDEPGPVAPTAIWFKRDVAALMRKHKFRFDPQFSTGNPVTLQFKKAGSEKDARLIVADLTKLLHIKFQPGVQNTYSPFVRITKQFTPVPDVTGYFVVTHGLNNGIAVRFST